MAMTAVQRDHEEGLVIALQDVHERLAGAVASLSPLPEASPMTAALAAMSTDELAQVTDLVAAINRLADAAMVRTVAAVEEYARLADPGESLAARSGFRDSPSYVIAVTGASRATVTRWRQVGAATSGRTCGSTGVLPPLLPHVAEALDSGALGLDQAAVIRRHLLEATPRAHPDDLDAAERALVGAALGTQLDDDDAPHLPLSPEQLAVVARTWRDAIDPDGVEPSYEQQVQRRSFTLSHRSDGMWVGKLLLPPDQGEALRLALDAHNAPRTAIRDEHEPSIATAGPGADPTAADLALADEHATGIGLSRRGRLDDRSTQQRQADTLVAMVTRAMELRGAPRIGGDAATVVITISSTELDKHAETGGGAAYLEQTGEPLPAHVAARVICDGNIQTCVLDEDGLPLKLGRRRRSHTRHQRRAILTAYPGGCQNPGCDAPPGFTEIHHPIWWSEGGLTDTDNGIPLCAHCHAEVHAGRLLCLRDATGRWYVAPTYRIRRRVGLAA